MKKMVAVGLTALFLLGAVVFFPTPADAREIAKCYSNLSSCRHNANVSGDGWFRTTLMLTVCDIAFGKCVLDGGAE